MKLLNFTSYNRDAKNPPGLNSNQYDSYFPSSTCEKAKTVFGSGRESAELTVEWALKYSHHTSNISSVLAKETLKETIDSIQAFLKDNFKYNLPINHDVLSPACAWSIRKVGISCKHFSIFASTVLINLRIKHYFRFVRYEKENHVYIVIPKDQKKALLNDSDVFEKDYFTIDGAGNNTFEPPFSVKFFDVSPSKYKQAQINKKVLFGLSIGFILLSINNNK